MGKEDDMSSLVAKRGLTSAISTSEPRNIAADLKTFLLWGQPQSPNLSIQLSRFVFPPSI
jgi:hypothetical protein